MELPCKDIKSIHNALFIEHNVQRIITNQEQNGVQFNSRKARRYICVLEERRRKLYDQIRPFLSAELSTPYSGPVLKPYLKSGAYSSQVTNWFGADVDQLVGGPFTRIEYHEPDLGSRKKLIAQLLRLGWKPYEYTDKGSPKLTIDGEPCPSLARIDSKVGQWISDWYTYRHRQSQIEGWLSLVRPDGRISAEAITIGTPTFRFRHKGVVNVPRSNKRTLFGKQMRSLFKAKKGYVLVGYDASGLELRMLADAINDAGFTFTVVYGKQETGDDIHTKNQRDAGLPTRDDAKTFIYAFIYGAGNAKIGIIIGGTVADGKRIRDRFLRANPGLAACITATQAAAGRGYLISVDGRRIHMRRDPFTGEIQTHKALNTRLQCAGALVMKWAMVLLDYWITETGLDAKKVLDMHDEGQHEVLPAHAKLFGQMAVMSIVKAGELLQLNVPLDGEYKIGKDWSETH